MMMIILPPPLLLRRFSNKLTDVKRNDLSYSLTMYTCDFIRCHVLNDSDWLIFSFFENASVLFIGPL